MSTVETKVRKRHNETNVPDVDFITAFIKGHAAGKTTKEIAEELNLAPGSVTTRASSMRKAGVNLPKFQGGNGQKLDIASLNELVADLNKAE